MNTHLQRRLTLWSLALVTMIGGIGITLPLSAATTAKPPKLPASLVQPGVTAIDGQRHTWEFPSEILWHELHITSSAKLHYALHRVNERMAELSTIALREDANTHTDHAIATLAEFRRDMNWAAHDLEHLTPSLPIYKKHLTIFNQTITRSQLLLTQYAAFAPTEAKAAIQETQQFLREQIRTASLRSIQSDNRNRTAPTFPNKESIDPPTPPQSTPRSVRYEDIPQSVLDKLSPETIQRLKDQLK